MYITPGIVNLLFAPCLCELATVPEDVSLGSARSTNVFPLTIGGFGTRLVISFKKVMEKAGVLLLDIFGEGSRCHLPGGCSHKGVFGVGFLGHESHHNGNRGIVEGVLSICQTVNYAFDPFSHNRP